MRFSIPPVLLCALVFMSGGPATCQGKIVNDPNAPGGAKLSPEDVAKSVDARLAKPVTYACGQRRVHEVADDLSKLTEVSIRGGKGKTDWRSRDIPIVVCAKDVPLGKLLRAITAATHLNLFSERLGEKEKPQERIYRLWRDKQRQDKIDEFFTDKEQADRDRAVWDWNASVRYKDVPESELTDNERKDQQRPFALGMSELLSALGPDARDRVMDGDTIRLTLDTAPANLRGTLENVFRSEWKTDWDSEPEKATKNPTDDDWKRSAIIIYYDQEELWTHVRDPFGTTNSWHLNMYLSHNMFSRAKKYDLPEWPKHTNDPPVDDPDLAFTTLSRKKDFQNPVLQVKLDLKAPEGERKPTYADLFNTLAEKSGFSIICEDFESHKAKCDTTSYYKSGTTLGAVLMDIQEPSRHLFKWHLDEADKILIGRAGEWPERHKNLVPQETVDRIGRALNGSGLDIDEYAEMLSLDLHQYFDWISDNRELGIAEQGFPAYRQLWQFYNSLSPEEKAEVKSEHGLSLSKLDPERVAKPFTDYLKAKREGDLHSAGITEAERPKPEATDPDEIERQNVNKFPSDPKLLADMVIWLKKVEGWGLPERNTIIIKPASTKGFIEKRQYALLFEWEENGEKRHTRSASTPRLPIYSRKRLKELYPDVPRARGK